MVMQSLEKMDMKDIVRVFGKPKVHFKVLKTAVNENHKLLKKIAEMMTKLTPPDNIDNNTFVI